MHGRIWSVRIRYSGILTKTSFYSIIFKNALVLWNSDRDIAIVELNCISKVKRNGKMVKNTDVLNLRTNDVVEGYNPDEKELFSGVIKAFGTKNELMRVKSTLMNKAIAASERRIGAYSPELVRILLSFIFLLFIGKL